jgi:hypothetical protein
MSPQPSAFSKGTSLATTIRRNFRAAHVATLTLQRALLKPRRAALPRAHWRRMGLARGRMLVPAPLTCDAASNQEALPIQPEK